MGVKLNFLFLQKTPGFRTGELPHTKALSLPVSPIQFLYYYCWHNDVFLRIFAK